MNISLSPDLEKRITEKVERGDAESADALIEHALTFYLEYEGGDMAWPQFATGTLSAWSIIITGTIPFFTSSLSPS